jgi:hypothetical protein
LESAGRLGAMPINVNNVDDRWLVGGQHPAFELFQAARETVADHVTSRSIRKLAMKLSKFLFVRPSTPPSI